jgi:hypothetical protein
MAGEQGYANLGLRGYLSSFILSGDVARADDGGRLAQLALKTRVGNIAAVGQPRAARRLHQRVLPRSSDPVRTRDELRAEGVVAGGWQGMFFPLSLECGATSWLRKGKRRGQGRISAYRDGTAISNALRWQSLGGARVADGCCR